MQNGENYRCDCCGAEVQSAAIEVRKWDWFKCYLPRTHHYCPSCKESAEARAMFAKSRVKPSNAMLSDKMPRHGLELHTNLRGILSAGANCYV